MASCLRPTADEKLTAMRSCLNRGPVALQETHWGTEQPTQLITQLPGVQVVATPAQIKHTQSSCPSGTDAQVDVDHGGSWKSHFIFGTPV